MRIKLIIAVLICALACQCSKDLSTEVYPEHNIDFNAQEQAIISSSQDFGFEIFSRLQADTPDSNIFISPLSISMALGMALNGANSETETAIRQTLGLENLSQTDINLAYKNIIETLIDIDPQTMMEIANSMWYHKDYLVLPEFINVNRQYFNAQVEAADFADPQTVTDINNWVADKTHDKIDKIIEQIGRDAYLFLINAIYFKGTWVYEFDKENTIADYPFKTLDNQVEPVEMMVQTNEEFQYLQDEDVQLINLPYGNEHFAMSIILPKKADDFNTWAANYTESEWRADLQAASKQKGTLFLPKFKTEYSKLLNKVLIDMGMGIAFTGQADFSGINGAYDLFISFVRHKSFVQVDEQGTEAAAVTIIGFERTSVGDNEFYMIANRPFLYIIHEKDSGAVLFMGKLLNPNEGE